MASAPPKVTRRVHFPRDTPEPAAGDLRIPGTAAHGGRQTRLKRNACPYLRNQIY